MTRIRGVPTVDSSCKLYLCPVFLAADNVSQCQRCGVRLSLGKLESSAFLAQAAPLLSRASRCPADLLPIASMSNPIQANIAGGNCATYEYRTLTHTDSIRLIELLPGAKGTPLACNIIDVRKGDQPEYEALSYAWGEPIFSHEIMEVTSNTMLRLTVNLHDALQALRDEHKTRIIWADAIAINQLDLKEKGHQVALMGPIYRDAQRVVVWLGCPKAAPGRIAVVLKDLIEAVEFRERNIFVIPLERAMWRLSALGLLQQPWYASQFLFCFSG
jgi:hypothetical protein